MPAFEHIRAAQYFDLTIALRLACAAELSYADSQVIEETVIRTWGYPHVRFFDVETTQCFVAADTQTVVVCFRGTEANRYEDWLADLDMELVVGPLDGRVHEGFYDALSCVWQLIDREVTRLLAAGPRRLWVTGHSLGAALATLAVARWLEAGCAVRGLYTFGQPRTGDNAFARNFDFLFRPHTFRIVNDQDVVTQTPPSALGYQHLGTLIHFTDFGTLIDGSEDADRSFGGWRRAVEKLLAWSREGLDDHRMIYYRRRIATALRLLGDVGQPTLDDAAGARVAGTRGTGEDSVCAQAAQRPRARRRSVVPVEPGLRGATGQDQRIRPRRRAA